MAQREGTDELLLGVLVLHGIDGDGIGGADALVARTAVAHDRDECTAHAGIGGQCGLGEDAGEDGVAKDAVTQWPVHGLAQAVAVVALDGLLGGLEVVVAGLENEANFVEWGLHGEVIDQAKFEFNVALVAIAAAVRLLVEQHLGVARDVHKAGVRPADDGAGGMATSLAQDLNIQFVAFALLELDVDASLINVLLALLDGLGTNVLDDLELVLALADDGAQGDGDGQADHACAGDAHAHGVLEDVGTQQGGDFLRFSAQCLGGAGYTQCHCHGLGTAHSGDNLALHQRDNLLSNVLLNHIVKFLVLSNNTVASTFFQAMEIVLKI